MAQPPHAIAIDVERTAGQVVVTLTGQHAQRRQVGYTLAVSGRSTTRHAGRSAVGPHPQTLSVVRFTDEPPWRIHLEVHEEGRPPYTIRCTSDGGECAES